MFDGVKRSTSEAVENLDASKLVDTEKIKEQAAALAATLQEAGEKVGPTATQLAGQAKERAGQFGEWAKPRVEKAWQDGVQAAAPRVEAAAAKASPAIDTAHDKIVSDYIPKVVAAVNIAAAKAADAATAGSQNLAASTEDTVEKLSRKARKALAATEKSAHKAAKQAEKAAAKADKKSHKVLWTVVGLGAAGTAFVLWRRAQPTSDPWAEPTDSPRFDDVVADAKHAAGSAAEAVGEAAGAAVAKGKEAGEKVSEVVEEATQATKDAAKKATSRARSTTRKAAGATSDTAQDAADAVADGAQDAADATSDAAESAADAVDDATGDTPGTRP
ncbi:hypothetical protein CLV28_2616 [Sediminihabitans luteus]|uniref:Uncharacterized protein n=1 Tax=Sediminihabitans luteus TaxID=1138585 RepID=A0A2M9CCN9_9CELL|nr:hypothetical protein [Sediminihabitans luteus]PJJ69157.1 hypothetical protein CLV28_2616 [Sediminihabitans luteus]GII98829.1 hypothetical protein Slu03_12070 [Sediminihabitans luteus]